MNIKGFVKNFFYTFLANGLSFAISAILVLVVPKRLGTEQYAYWQLYTFYTSYVGFFHLGWCDGVYLKYGGAYYEKLDKPMFVTQFWYIVTFELFTLFGLSIVGSSLADVDTGFVVTFTGLCALLVIPRTYLAYVLQITNRIKEYSVVMILEKLAYFLLVLGILLFGITSYKPMLLADLCGKLLALGLAVWFCKDCVVGKFVHLYDGMREMADDIGVGFKLMIANIASMLIIGIVRQAIVWYWDIETFGKVSLTLSVSNLLSVFINAVSLIMFPALARAKKDRLPALYTSMRNMLMFILLAALVIYYPVKTLLVGWLPKYEEGLRYMALIFPMCIFESKTNMLVNTYLKIMRREKQIMIVNVTTVILSLALTSVTVALLHDLTLALLSIVILLAFRCIFSEVLLADRMHLSVNRDIILEVIMAAVFILSGWYIHSFLCTAVYAAALLLYCLVKHKDLKETVLFTKKLLKKQV